MPPTENTDEHLLDYLILANNDLADLIKKLFVGIS
jgi:hypothetical protein